MPTNLDKSFSSLGKDNQRDDIEKLEWLDALMAKNSVNEWLFYLNDQHLKDAANLSKMKEIWGGVARWNDQPYRSTTLYFPNYEKYNGKVLGGLIRNFRMLAENDAQIFTSDNKKEAVQHLSSYLMPPEPSNESDRLKQESQYLFEIKKRQFVILLMTLKNDITQEKILRHILGEENLKQAFLEIIDENKELFNKYTSKYANVEAFLERINGIDLSKPMPEQIKMQRELSELAAAKEKLTDTVTEDEIENPYILPSGYSIDEYTRDNIIKNNEFRDPFTQSTHSASTIKENHLLKSLIQTLNSPSIDTTKTHQLLTCDITGKSFQDPVVAADGWTYERKALIEFLSKNNDKTPTGVKQSKNKEGYDIYPNRAIKDFMESPYYKNTIQPSAPADTQKDQWLHVIREYIIKRLPKSEYKGFFSKGIPKTEKLQYSYLLIQVIQGKQSPDVILNNPRAIQVLEDKTLGESVKPILDALRKNSAVSNLKEDSKQHSPSQERR